jgi:ketosteroid isomerase-like protein
VDKLLTDEFVANFDGRTQNKKQFLAAMKANPAKVESAVTGEMRAVVFGDTAVVHGVYVEKSTLNGKDMRDTYRYTDIFAKRAGRWQCVAGHANKVQ